MQNRRCIGVAVDAILYAIENKEVNIILIKRKKEPFKGRYALPGGFVEYEEIVEEAIEREVREEVGIGVNFKLEDQFHVFSSPIRDPRGHIITIVYKKQLPQQKLQEVIERKNIDKEEISNIALFPLNSLPQLAFDHGEILSLFRLKI